MLLSCYRFLKCPTVFLRDQKGERKGCLCINFDVTDFVFLSTAFSDFSSLNQSTGREALFTSQEHYTKTFVETMDSLIDATVAECGEVPAMMDKAEKNDLISRLDRAGLFMIKGSVDYLARVFGVSRYAIYSYLKEERNFG
jgi:predicted transcriptional regulator YheO